MSTPTPIAPRRVRSTERSAIAAAARRHGLRTVRCWPPTQASLDLLVGGDARQAVALRRDLERELRRPVVVYLADEIPHAVWGRILVETVSL